MTRKDSGAGGVGEESDPPTPNPKSRIPIQTPPFPLWEARLSQLRVNCGVRCPWLGCDLRTRWGVHKAPHAGENPGKLDCRWAEIPRPWARHSLGEVGDAVLGAPVHAAVLVSPAEVSVPTTVVPESNREGQGSKSRSTVFLAVSRGISRPWTGPAF